MEKGLFFKYLGTSHEDLYAERVNLLAEGIKAASEDIIRDLEKQERVLRSAIEHMLDFGVRNSQDLSPVDTIDPVVWSTQYHAKKLELELLQQRLKVNRKSHKELFTGLEEPSDKA